MFIFDDVNIFNFKQRYVRKLNVIISIAVFFVCKLLSLTVNAQLAGEYTVGTSDSDYVTLSFALAAIDDEEIADTVVFLLSQKTHNISPSQTSFLTGVHSTYPVIFRGESENPEDVIIKSSNNQYVVSMYWCENIYFENVHFQMYEFDFNWCSKIGFYNCIMPDFDAWRSDTFCFQNCVFEGVVSAYVDVVRNNNNLYKQKAEFIGDQGQVIGNTFLSYVYLNEGYGAIISDNVFHSLLDLSTNKNYTFFRNYVKGLMDIDECENSIFFNNQFIGGISAWPGWTQAIKIYYNNFSPEALVHFDYCEGLEVGNNNLPGRVSWVAYGPTTTDKIFNNNYFPGYGFKGRDCYHFDPEYLSDSLLVSQNGCLAGLGRPVAGITDDFYSVQRGDCPSIGANEFSVTLDTLRINCGEEIRLKLDSLPNDGLGDWFPEEYLSQLYESSPLAMPAEDITYYFRDTSGVSLDSVTIIVDPFVINIEDDEELICGEGALLLHQTMDLDYLDLYWEPQELVLQAGDFYYYTYPDETTVFVVDIFHDVCGHIKDSVKISVDEQPFAYFYRERLDDFTYRFDNSSMCYNSVLWDFGDGCSSVEINPVHTYSDCRDYLVSLIVYGDYSSDTVMSFVSVYHTGIDDEDKQSFVVSPNPSNGDFVVNFGLLKGEFHLSIVNVLGNVVHQEKVRLNGDGQEMNFFFPDFISGTYVMSLSNDIVSVNRKIVIY